MTMLPTIHSNEHHHFGPVSNGLDALMIKEAFTQSCTRPIFYIARDDLRMDQMQQYLRFVLPKANVHLFPAWDCLPYDRISPNSEITSQRIATLSNLVLDQSSFLAPTILISTVNAVLQRLPARELWQQHVLSLEVGKDYRMEEITKFLVENAYIRTGNVTDNGEFAVRGSILDLFPSGYGHGYRLDFFGDTLDSIRTFDPLSQISQDQQESLTLLPAKEVIINQETIRHFRHHYRVLFGAPSLHDNLYESISQERRYAGMEHWLSLFYPKLETIFDYIPADSLIMLDHLVEESVNERLALIEDYYQARIEAKSLRNMGETIYNPTPPEHLYVSHEEYQQQLYNRPCCHLSGFAKPAAKIDQSTHQEIHHHMDTQAVPDFIALSKKEQQTPADLLIDFLLGHFKSGKKLVIGCSSKGNVDRIHRLLSTYDVKLQIIDSAEEIDQLSGHIGLAVFPIPKGFMHDQQVWISEQDILGEKIIRRRRQAKKSENFLSEVTSLSPEELVVHQEHGIGRFKGLETLTIQGIPHDFILLHYEGDDKLFVPVENIDTISRYGSEDGVRLDKLGSANWQERKARQKKRIQMAAEELLRIAAERELKQATILEPGVGLYEEFCARFPYAETEDQLTVLEEIRQDLASGKPMDRLVCGDVGFGKTEIALRTAFMAVSATGDASGQPPQVAVIVPTTLLARQHYQTFKERFKGLPVTIAQLSRMVSPKEAKQTREAIKNGTVDIVVGTHALLAKNMAFKNLSMMILDEEQHFGVAQKERLKSLASDIHVLTLTATPIPRTLQMSLSGIKTLSILATPPVDRLAIRTYVLPFDGVVIREAILREHYRGGRVFYVCPRIHDLNEVEQKLKALVPEIRMMVAHGQMAPTKLEDIMNAFYDGKFELLLSTTIVESGLDIPSANTIIIHKADRFGLAQLYQLRGRVGRSNIRAYAYLTTPPKAKPTDNAIKRLQVMQSLDTLGAGFNIASHDMDIRGFGNLVGDEQSGHIKEVGIELYQKMLKDAVEKAKIQQSAQYIEEAAIPDEDWSPILNLHIPILIPDNYINDISIRMGMYKRIAYLHDSQDIEDLRAEMVDRFGKIPEETKYLLEIIQLKQLCKQTFIEKIDVGSKGVVMSFKNNYFPNPEKLLNFIDKKMPDVKLRQDHKIVFLAVLKGSRQKIDQVKKYILEIFSLIKD